MVRWIGRVEGLGLLTVLGAGLVMWETDRGSSAQVQRTQTIYLNGSPVASMSDLRPLGKKIESFAEPQMAIPSNSQTEIEPPSVYIKVGSSVPLLDLQKLASLVWRSGGQPQISVADESPASTTFARKTDGSTLVISTEKDASSVPDETAFEIYGSVASTAARLKTGRVVQPGLEIDNAGQYLRTEKPVDNPKHPLPSSAANLDATYDLSTYQVSEHSVPGAELSKAVLDLIALRQQQAAAADRKMKEDYPEMPAYKPSTPTISVIVGAATPYSQLLPILRAAKGKHVKFDILIRPAGL